MPKKINLAQLAQTVVPDWQDRAGEDGIYIHSFIAEAAARIRRGVFVAPFLSTVQPDLDQESVMNVARALEQGRPVPLVCLGGDQFINSTDQALAMGMLSAALDEHRTHTVAIVGSGCGIVPAVAAEAGMDVTAIELRHDLAQRSRQTLAKQGYSAVQIHEANAIDFFRQGTDTFDAIVVFAAIPMTKQGVAARSLFQTKLTSGGKLVFPFGNPDNCLMQVYDNVGPCNTWSMACAFTPFLLD